MKDLMQRIARKLGSFTQRKNGEEYLFACPKCHHHKLEINPRKKLFHCFRCGYKGTLRQVLLDLRIEHDVGIYTENKKAAKAIHNYMEEAEGENEFEIPGFKRVITIRAEEFLRTKKVSDDFRGGHSEHGDLRGRLVIPIVEWGKVVSYIARSVDGSQPKELSGPNRSWFLYNIDDVVQGKPVVLVEGIFDCEAVRRAGYTSCAVMGCHISDIQIGKLLSREPSKIILMLDGDKAGAEGTAEAYRKLLKRTHTPVVSAGLTDDLDPDELPTQTLKSLLDSVAGSG